MQVILQENVEKLGTRGQVVEVSPGYARNFLLPRNLAIEATPGNLKRLEKIRATLAKKEATERDSAARLAELLGAVTLTLRRKAGESDHLFGSVTAADISEALAAQGYTVDKRKIRLDDPIKLIGEFTVPVKLHHDVETTVKVVVDREA
jgi:large subunit ribosomal protein L9